MSILCFDVPKKIRSSNKHNELNSSDCGVAGTYVPNMSNADNKKWKARHIKGDEERVEIRKSFNGTQVVIKVYKNEIVMSANSKIHMQDDVYAEFLQAVQEAKNLLK